MADQAVSKIDWEGMRPAPAAEESAEPRSPNVDWKFAEAWMRAPYKIERRMFEPPLYTSLVEIPLSPLPSRRHDLIQRAVDLGIEHEASAALAESDDEVK